MPSTSEGCGPVGVQRRAMKMVRKLEHLCYADRLRELRLFIGRREGSRESLEHLPAPKGALQESWIGTFYKIT